MTHRDPVEVIVALNDEQLVERLRQLRGEVEQAERDHDVGRRSDLLFAAETAASELSLRDRRASPSSDRPPR